MDQQNFPIDQQQPLSGIVHIVNWPLSLLQSCRGFQDLCKTWTTWVRQRRAKCSLVYARLNKTSSRWMEVCFVWNFQMHKQKQQMAQEHWQELVKDLSSLVKKCARTLLQPHVLSYIVSPLPNCMPYACSLAHCNFDPSCLCHHLQQLIHPFFSALIYQHFNSDFLLLQNFDDLWIHRKTMQECLQPHILQIWALSACTSIANQWCRSWSKANKMSGFLP